MVYFYLCRSSNGVTNHGALWHGLVNNEFWFSMLSCNESTWIVPGTIED